MRRISPSEPAMSQKCPPLREIYGGQICDTATEGRDHGELSGPGRGPATRSTTRPTIKRRPRPSGKAVIVRPKGGARAARLRQRRRLLERCACGDLQGQRHHREAPARQFRAPQGYGPDQGQPACKCSSTCRCKAAPDAGSLGQHVPTHAEQGDAGIGAVHCPLPLCAPQKGRPGNPPCRNSSAGSVADFKINEVP